MKHFAALLTLSLVISISCKEKVCVNEVSIPLLQEIEELSGMSEELLYNSYSDKCLIPNQFNFVGEEVFKVFKDFTKTYSSMDVKGISPSELLTKMLLENLPKNVTSLTDESFSNEENDIYALITQSLCNDTYTLFNFKVALIED